jgi:hypothetical protein
MEVTMNTIRTEADSLEGFTTRVLFSLVTELATAQQAVASITLQVGAIAAAHGVAMVDPELSSPAI